MIRISLHITPFCHFSSNYTLFPLMNCFLSDPQAALSATDMALALNRYLCTAVLPLLTKCAPLFAGTEPFASLIDSLLHTVYRLSKGCCLTKAQRDAIEEGLLAVCGCVRACLCVGACFDSFQFVCTY